MKKYLILFIGILSLFGFMIGSGNWLLNGRLSVQSQGMDPQAYLPIVYKPAPTPTATPAPNPTPSTPVEIQNPSFENGWKDLPPQPGNLINQQPNDWKLSWVEIGELLYDSSNDKAGGIPECTHKLAKQLPPDEQPGGENALILDGTTVYKIFNSGAPFGAKLTQEIENLPPGSTWRITVPIQVHLYKETDPYGAESSLWVNGEGKWANGAVMGDREWYDHVVEFVVPANGKAQLTVLVKSKWAAPKDFFIDDLQLERVN